MASVDMKKETIERLMAGCRDDDARASRIAKALGEHEQTKRAISAYHRDMQGEESRRRAATEVLRGKLRDIQEKCPHLETTYYGDPSGGHDSHTSCDLCGKELPR